MDIIKQFSSIEKQVDRLDITLEANGELKRDLLDSLKRQAAYCPNHAPHIFYRDDNGINHLVQGCCNDWNCPRCGQIRARQEFRRMLHGADAIEADGQPLYFMTITCQGKELPVDLAEKDYLKWSNRLLSALRADAKRNGKAWIYAQVTERQKRKHPHSHFLTTYCPNDVVAYARGEWLPNERKAKHDTLWSDYLRKRCVSAGLGIECDLSRVNSAVAVAVYLAKYLFKAAQETVWGKNWRRIRYSHSFPKPTMYKPELTFPIVHWRDWNKLLSIDGIIYADCEATLAAAYTNRITNVVYTGEMQYDETEIDG